MLIKNSSSIDHKLPKGRNEENYPFALSDVIFNTGQLFVSSEKVRAGSMASSPHFHK